MDQIVSLLANREVHTGTREAAVEPTAQRAPEESEAMDEKKKQTVPEPKPEPKRTQVSAPSSSMMLEKSPRPDPRIESKKEEPKKESRGRDEPDYGIFASLPPRYASHRLALIARDPNWAFAYWDVDRDRGAPLFQPGAQVVLRLCDANDGRVLMSPRVHPESGRYYFRLPSGDQRYQLTLNAVFADGREVEVLRSNVAFAAPELPRPKREARFVSMRTQIGVLEQARQISSPPRLVCEEARRLSIYPTPSVAGQALTLLPLDQRPDLEAAAEGSGAAPGPVSFAEVSNVRAVLSGSEVFYVGGGSSSAELLKKDRP